MLSFRRFRKRRIKKLKDLYKITKNMKQYKVESLVYYSKMTLDKEHIVKSSTADIQEKLDEYAADGWRLISTNATDFGFAVYFYLYFEKDANS